MRHVHVVRLNHVTALKHRHVRRKDAEVVLNGRGERRHDF